MSVLTCPVCQGGMREVNKNGVLIDTCTQCRGVWLDRGELEKLAAIVTDDAPGGSFLGNASRPAPPPYPQQGRPHPPNDRPPPGYGYGRRDDDDDDDDRRRMSGYGGKRRKSFLDLFD